MHILSHQVYLMSHARIENHVRKSGRQEISNFAHSHGILYNEASVFLRRPFSISNLIVSMNFALFLLLSSTKPISSFSEPYSFLRDTIMPGRCVLETLLQPWTMRLTVVCCSLDINLPSSLSTFSLGSSRRLINLSMPGRIWLNPGLDMLI